MTPHYDSQNGADPHIIEEVKKTILEYVNNMAREGDKTTAKIAKRFGHNLSQRTPEIRWPAPRRSAIETRTGFLGRKTRLMSPDKRQKSSLRIYPSS
jgi:hypothetical protein